MFEGEKLEFIMKIIASLVIKKKIADVARDFGIKKMCYI
jgi:hypothetical protein